MWRVDGFDIYCQKCAKGVNGIIKSVLNNTYIDCGSVSISCDTNNNYEPAVFDNFTEDLFNFAIPYRFTCYKCSQSNEIPFVFVGSENELLTYHLDNLDNIPTATVNLNNV